MKPLPKEIVVTPAGQNSRDINVHYNSSISGEWIETNCEEFADGDMWGDPVKKLWAFKVSMLYDMQEVIRYIENGVQNI